MSIPLDFSSNPDNVKGKINMYYIVSLSISRMTPCGKKRVESCGSKSGRPPVIFAMGTPTHTCTVHIYTYIYIYLIHSNKYIIHYHTHTCLNTCCSEKGTNNIQQRSYMIIYCYCSCCMSSKSNLLARERACSRKQTTRVTYEVNKQVPLGEPFSHQESSSKGKLLAIGLISCHRST